jgi:hypothetical protein
MPGIHNDNFLDTLERLSEIFPEYAEILQLLIERIQQGRVDEIKEMLENLNDEEW